MKVVVLDDFLYFGSGFYRFAGLFEVNDIAFFDFIPRSFAAKVPAGFNGFCTREDIGDVGNVFVQYCDVVHYISYCTP